MADLHTDIRYVKGVGETRLLKSWAFSHWAT